tara:strand:- start:553 stop:1230 length:678 start_codon:yes stop_codon:yes gene_type:complete
MKSKYFFFIKRFLYYFYGEKFYKRLSYNWSNYPSRFQIIQKIIDFKKYNSYLEIGCDQNKNFSNITINKKIGVDPNSGGTHRMTSDSFFEKSKSKFDIIFIDGLHTYEQVKKDIENSLNALNPKGIILIHDCLPKKIWNQIVPRLYGHWNGDVWKALVEFRTYKDLDTYTCVADHGIGIIIKRPNRSILETKIKNFKKLKFKDYFTNHEKFMNLVQSENLIEIIR